jgi:hypothetical protein
MKGFVRRGMLVVLAALLPAGSAAASPSSQPTPFPVVNGGVYSIAVDGTTAYLAGDFTRIGPLSGPMALLSAADGSVQQTFPDIAGRRDVFGASMGLYAIEPDGNGGWYAGGEFLRAGGRFRTSLMHLLPDGTVDPAFAVEIGGGTVGTIELDRDTGTLWIGGSFQYVDGLLRWHVAALDAATGEPRPWLEDGISGGVGAIEVHGDRVYLLGGFGGIEGDSHHGVVAIDRETGRLLDWDPRLGGSQGASDLDVRDGVVYIVGGFSSVGGVTQSKVAAVRESNGSLLPIDYGVRSGTVGAVVATDDELIVAGVENTREGARRGMAAFDRRTGALLPWFTDVAGRPSNFATTADRLYADSISEIRGRQRVGPAAFDLDTGEPLGWEAPWPDGGIQDIEVAGGQVAIAGGFRMLGGIERRDVAAVDLRTNTVITGFDAKLEEWRESAVTLEAGRVWALAVHGGSLWIGGTFTRAAGASRPWLTQVDNVTGAPGAAPPAPSKTVTSLAVHNGRLYVGGEFSRVGGQTRYNAAAIDLATGTLTPFAHNFDCEVEAFMPFGPDLLLGGCFAVGSESGLAVVDPDSGAADGVTPPQTWPEYVSVVAPDGEGGAWVGGNFDTLGQAGPARFGRIRADGSVDPRAPVVDGDVVEVETVGGETYVGGEFRMIAGQARQGVAAFRTSDGVPARWDPRPYRGAGEIVPLPDGGALVGGGMDTFELSGARGIARFGPQPSGVAVPQATAPPAVMGEQFVDDYLGTQRTDGGEWTGSPHRRDIVWLRCDANGAACEDTGRRGTGIRQSAADVGHRFRVEVVAVNDGGASAPIRSAPGPMVLGPRPEGYNEPEIAGEAKEGSTLTMTSNGDWSGAPTSFHYQWSRCMNWGCREIRGATGTSYTLTAAEINSRVAVVVTGVNAAGEGSRASRDSQVVVPATRGTPRNTRAPSIAGVMRNPTTLYADPGDWTDYPDQISIRWDRCDADGTACEEMSRQGRTFEVGAADAGKRFRVRVREWYSVSVSDEATSDLTPPIPAPGAPADPPSDPEPDPPPSHPAPDPPSDPAPAPSPRAGAGPVSTPKSPPAAERPRVQILSVRLRGTRHAVVQLQTSAPVRARVELRRGARRLAAADAELAGTTRVQLRLTAAARQRLRRREALTGRVVVAATGLRLARGPVRSLRR